MKQGKRGGAAGVAPGADEGPAPVLPWLIVGAVDRELKPLRGRIESLMPRAMKRGSAWDGQWNGIPVLLARTGVGPHKARAMVAALLGQGRVRGILSIGFAGALEPGWKVGDIVIPEEVHTLPPLVASVHRPDADLTERARGRAVKNGWVVRSGRMLTSDRVICSPREKIRLGRLHRAGSVEMESAVLAELAREASVPLLVVRVISDEAGFSMPATLALLSYLRRRRFGQAARCVMAQPLDTVRLVRLLRHTQRASLALTRFLEEEILDERVLGTFIPDTRGHPGRGGAKPGRAGPRSLPSGGRQSRLKK